eukprot:SAG31_NODE_713_length_12651_cov_180.009481_10_plen_178_part_00
MCGESSSLAVLCEAMGDSSCMVQMRAEAARWQRRLLRLWNPALESFDTLRLGNPPAPPPSPHPSPPAPPAPVPIVGWTLLRNHSGTFCCDQSACKNGGSSFLFSGKSPMSKCIARCLADSRCEYVTIANDGWCQNAEYCNATGTFKNGDAETYERPPAMTTIAPAAAPSPPQFAGVR